MPITSKAYQQLTSRQSNNKVGVQPQNLLLGALGGLTGVGSVVGSIFNTVSQARQNKLNREFAERQADKAWQRETEHWDKQNEYNSPLQKMARLREAGLNPNLAYGNPTTAGVASGKAPTAEMAKYQGQAPKLEVARALAEIRNIEADTKATITGEKYTGSKMIGQGISNETDQIKLDLLQTYGKQQLLAKLGLMQTGKDLNLAKEKLIEAQRVLTDNKANLMKMGLNNSDNPILRMIGTWGVKNPLQASELLIWLGNLGNKY